MSAPATSPADDDVLLPARTDARPLPRRLAAPLLAAAGTLAAVGYVAAFDPNEPGHFPMCPTQALFGVDCPACGGLRAVHALAHGDVIAAVDYNVVAVIAVPAVLIWWVRWLVRSVRGTRPAVTFGEQRRQTRASVVVLVALAVFGIVRNFVPFLGSGT